MTPARARTRTRMRGGLVAIALAWGFALAWALAACAGSRAASHEGEGADTSGMPADVRADYEVFAQRCSKCHSLSRPLQSGIDDDEYWREYVARMRRQPGSGISPQDEVVILRYLHYFSLEQRRKKAHGEAPAPSVSPAPAPSSAPSPTPAGGT